MSENKIIICGVDEAQEILEKEDIFAVVSIAETTEMRWRNKKERRPTNLNKAQKVLRFWFDDVEDPFSFSVREWDMIVPKRENIKQLIAFARLIQIARPGQKGTVLIHCQAGQSRSTACAFVMLCWAMGPGNEVAAWRRMCESGVGQTMDPNKLIVSLGDEVLKRRGKMKKVCEDGGAWFDSDVFLD